MINLAKQLTRQLPVQGARHLLWDMIIAEETKIKIYLNFIKDKEMVINATRHSFLAVNFVFHHHIFSGISSFWGSSVRQKYVEWVLVGCKI